MAIDNQLLQKEAQPTASLPDAYEAYWSSSANDSSTQSTRSPSPSYDALPFCRPGDAYVELWQHWDAQ